MTPALLVTSRRALRPTFDLNVLREHTKDERADLVYLDPPFNSQSNYNVPCREPTNPVYHVLGICYGFGMTDHSKPVPESFAEEIDALFSALEQAKHLLAVGRADGLCVGLSPRLAAEMVNRHGDAAAFVFSNTWRVDPKQRINGAS